MRTNALYRSRRLLLFLYFLGILSLSNMLACFLVIYHNTTWVTQSPFGSTHCASECSSSTCVAAQTLFWIPFSLLETFLALLTMWKYYCNCSSFSWTLVSEAKSNISSGQRRRSLDRSLVVATVARDGLCILNIILWVAVQSHSYSFLAIAIMKSLQSTICSRMLLNIRGLLEKSTFDDTATRISIHPNISQVVVTREGTLLHLTSVRSSVDLDDRPRHDYGYERGLQ
ncbi:hypothetical protein CVT26_016190 [Gymnopilus dilepis]|uniref:Uncharacterized protein n=1 Tax=Gymnopilus dilepis TaxID=231916 RepID=A0A409XYX0_9AGAR|nr:hypothetical protein CVT26_016190 [Gymnopilus dilepis]